MIAFILPMNSSMYAPASDNIASEYETDSQRVLLNQAGYVMMLGIGPLLIAPTSEVLGRRTMYIFCLAIFTLFQIPIALAPNIETFVALRTLSGFFGSVAVGNGGGSISDMMSVRERTKAIGFYVLWPLLSPALGPLIGSLIVDRMDWRYISWLNMILAAILTIVCYFCLHETRAIVILQERQAQLEEKDPDTEFFVEGVTDQSFLKKIGSNATRAVNILVTQPIVLTLSIYQALIFSTMYSLYGQYTTIWSASPYEFSLTQVGLAYLGPAAGFILTSFFVVTFIDRVYDWAAKENNDDGQPEYRLPMANIGAVLLPTSLFWFGWTIEADLFWPIPLAATVIFGASQVSIFNTVQTYYIDAYSSNAASALAAGAFLRSIVGGVVPLFVGPMFESIGYGFGMSVFGSIALVLMPVPLLFYKFGRRLREKFPFKG